MSGRGGHSWSSRNAVPPERGGGRAGRRAAACRCVHRPAAALTCRRTRRRVEGARRRGERAAADPGISRRPTVGHDPMTLASDAENWPTLGVDAAGRAVLAFQPGESGPARVRFRDAAGAWGHPIEVEADPASLVVSRSGEVLMTPPGLGSRRFSAGRSAVRSPATRSLASPPTRPSRAPAVVGGEPVRARRLGAQVVHVRGVGYMPDDDAGYALTAARSPAGRWRSLEDLRTDCSPVDDIRVAVNDAGAAAALTVRDGKATLSSSARPGAARRGCRAIGALGWEWEQTQSRYPPVPGVAPQPAPGITRGRRRPVRALRLRRCVSGRSASRARAATRRPA